MKSTHKYLFFLLLSFCSGLVTSCESDNEAEESINQDDNVTMSQLFNTSWIAQTTAFYTKNGELLEIRTNTISEVVQHLTFTDRQGEGAGKYIEYIDWYKNNKINGNTIIMNWNVKNGIIYNDGTGNQGKIIKLTPSEMQLYMPNIAYNKENMDAYRIITYMRTSEPDHSFKPGYDPDDSGQDSSNPSYEKPEIGFYDFTATKTSLKIEYKIYNKEESDITNAKIYYGTTDNSSSYTTATISGVLITANITGLKSGTNYYVKCTVTGKGGTTTTQTTKCITNF